MAPLMKSSLLHIQIFLNLINEVSAIQANPAITDVGFSIASKSINNLQSYNGEVIPAATSGCSKGFDAYFLNVDPLFRFFAAVFIVYAFMFILLEVISVFGWVTETFHLTFFDKAIYNMMTTPGIENNWFAKDFLRLSALIFSKLFIDFGELILQSIYHTVRFIMTFLSMFSPIYHIFVKKRTTLAIQ